MVKTWVMVASGGLGADDCHRCPVPRQQFVEPIDLVIVNAVEHVGQIGLRIDAVHLGRLDYRHGTCQCLRAGVSASEEPIFSSDSNAPFILPMSAMKLRFFIAGILILARGFPFAVLKNERQAGF